MSAALTDRELVELAAKAAGYKFDSTDPFEIAQEHKGGTNWVEWNPLTDDGDALRLAVTLRLIVTFTGAAGPHVSAGPRMGPFSNEPLPPTLFAEQHSSDCAATRRAIVRAAAEIGRAKQ